MKTNRFIWFSVLSLLLSIVLTSCGKEEYSTRIHELLLKKEITFEADRESGSLSTTMTFRNEDLSNYIAIADESWCHVSIDVLASTIKVTVDENNTFEDRSTIVTLSDIVDGVSTRTFSVIQKQNDVVRVIDESTTYEVATGGGQIMINVESNVSYGVQIPSDVDWITCSSSPTRGLVKSSVILDVAKNTSGAERSAQVFLINKESGARDIVTVHQKFDAMLEVLATEFYLDEKGGDVNIYVRSNVLFDFYTDAEDTWVQKSGNRKVIDNLTTCQTVNVLPFTEKEPSRSTKVYIQSYEHAKDAEVAIIQVRNLYIKETSIKLLSGSSQTLTLYNANSDAVLWKSADESIAMVDEEGTVIGISAGTTTVSVTSADGAHTDNVSVEVEQPVDLKDKLSCLWQESYTTIDDVSVLTHLSCTLTNNSEFDLQVSKASLNCDGNPLSSISYDEFTGSLPVGQSIKFDTDIEVEYAPDSIVRDTTINQETKTLEVTERIIKGAPIVNTHKYTLDWDYSYSKTNFTYHSEYPLSTDEGVASTRRKYVRSRRR